LWRPRKELEGLGLDALFVSFEPLAAAEAFLETTAIEWPILSDPMRLAYRAYGLESASLARAWF
jgi:peroxiredoxin